MKVPTVIFQVTAIGKNRHAIEESVESVLYWVRNTPRLGFRYLVWVVIEPSGYATAPELYERLRREGARLFVVPPEYRTRLGTVGKARALEYAAAMRRAVGLSNPSVWVYHQDEETCVGEDTLVGISEFVRQGTAAVGVGVILYPLDWSGNPSQVQEVTRSYDDLRVLDSITMPGNPTAGFHGSHILVRADVEDTVGWDARGYDPSEDLSFEIRVRARYGSVFGILKGFAYEKGAFSLLDQLRQRRRWMHGVLHAVFRSKDLPMRRRLTIGYSALSWFSALPSIAILLLSIELRYGPLTTITGVFTGFIWVSMVVAYLEGYRLHRPYLERPISWAKLFVNGVQGALIDVIAPWSSLFKRASTRDFINKDRAAAPARSRSTAPAPPRPARDLPPAGVGA